MKKLKVMHMIWNMGDGGAQKIVLNYLEAFCNDVDIEMKLYVYNNSNNSYYNKIIKEKYNDMVIYLNNPRINIPILKKIFNPIITQVMWKKAIKEYKPDIVHVHISALLKHVLFPIIFTKVPVRFDTLHSNPLRYKGIELRFIKSAFQKKSFIPICVTEEQARVAKQYYGFNKYEVVYNGIDISSIKNKIISKEEARKLYNMPDSAYIIIGVGRLNKIKRFDILIEAFSLCLKQNDKALLYIAGDGIEKSNLMSLIKKLNIEDKVKFLGNLNNVIPIYCAADMLGITSESESSSLVLIEAQVCGLHGVISNGVPNESIITENIKKMNSNATILEWSEALLNQNYCGKRVRTIDDYEVRAISKKMKQIYLKYWGEYKHDK